MFILPNFTLYHSQAEKFNYLKHFYQDGWIGAMCQFSVLPWSGRIAPHWVMLSESDSPLGRKQNFVVCHHSTNVDCDLILYMTMKEQL